MPRVKYFRFGGIGAELPDPPSGYMALTRQARCDANGNFMFANVPNGSYFVATIITWYADGGPYSFPQGGLLMTPVTISSGEEKQIVMNG